MLSKRIFLSLITACFASMLAAKQPARLIIRGVDLGFSHSGNLALTNYR